MKCLFTSILLLFSIKSFSQWSNLGHQHPDVFMLDNNTGYKWKNDVDPAYPQNGFYFEIEKTTNDWNSSHLAGAGASSDEWCCRLSNLYFSDDQHGIAGILNYSYYTFEMTNDGGGSWQHMIPYHYIYASDLILTEDTVAYLMGNYNAWELLVFRITPSSTDTLYVNDSLLFAISHSHAGNHDYVDFINSDTIFFIAKDSNNYYHILKTEDAGLNWDMIFENSASKINSISFITGNMGYFARGDGSIFMTDDGGASWNSIISPTSKSINSIDFYDHSTGYLACNDGELYRTLDGGQSWNRELPWLVTDFERVKFVDSNTVYCTDINGVLYKNESVLSNSENSINQRQISLYPNPAKESVFISGLDPNKVSRIKIYESTGRLIGVQSSPSIIINDYPIGLYYILVEADDATINLKLIKE